MLMWVATSIMYASTNHYIALHQWFPLCWHTWDDVAGSSPSIDQRLLQGPSCWVGGRVFDPWAWSIEGKQDSQWHWSMVHSPTIVISIQALIIHIISIAVIALFSGFRQFLQGCGFKQWTGNNSKALMKVYLPALKGYHSGKFELETRFVLEFLANSNILNRSFPTNLGSILQRNPVCGQVCKLPRNLSIVRVWLLYRTLVCIAISK